MNFGCGTLIVLLVLVVVAGKLIPHGRSNTPAPSHSTQGISQSQTTSVTNRERRAKPSSKVVDEPPELTFESMLSELKVWIDEKATEAEHQVIERAALPSGPAAEVLAKVEEEAKTLVSRRIAETTVPTNMPHQPAAPEKPVIKPAPGHTNPTHSVLPPSGGAKLAVEGRDTVFNNPWNHAVEPVERYLKQHVHDAASIEVLEWGQVEIVREGYQVRCIYKSKNVLGKMTTQSRLFILDHAAKVIDIRD